VTTAPPPSDVERIARGLEEGFCGHAAWLQPAAAELRRLQAENERLRGDYALRGAQIQRMAALIDELEGKVGRFQGVPLPLIEAINAATGSNDWQGDKSPAELLEPGCRAIEALQAERDEADRRAGAAERSAAALHETSQRFEKVRRRMKDQWGVHDNVSFDIVWQQALDAKQALAELEARKPLPPSYRAGAMTSSIDGGATVSLHFNDMAEAEAWFVAFTDQHDAQLVDKSPNLQEPLVDKTANLHDRTGSLPGITGGSS
jgi:multidrug efflux pump subunit AcrA (membrane-fusion protein)